MANEFVARLGLIARQDSQLTGSVNVTGSVIVTGSIRTTAGFTGSLFGTASYVTGALFTSVNPALSASYALSASFASNGGVTSVAGTANEVLINGGTTAVGGAVTVSLPSTVNLGAASSFTATSITGSISSSNLQGAISNAQLQNSSVTVGTTAISLGASSTTLGGLTSVSSTSLTGSITASSLQGAIANAQLQNSTVTVGNTSVALGATATTITGLTSLTSTSLTGSLLGTASYVTGALFTSTNPALSASYALNGGVTQIVAGTNVTISPTNGLGAVTINAAAGAAFPFTGDAVVSGSFRVTGSTGFTGSVSVINGGFTGSLFGTASYVTGSVFSSANPALSASYALSSSYSLNGGVTTVAGTTDEILVNGGTTAAAGAITLSLPSTVNLGAASSFTATSLTGSITASSLQGAITNAQLANSSVTVGNTNIALGATATTITGLASLTSTSLTGSLLGTASLATTASFYQIVTGSSGTNFNIVATPSGSIINIPTASANSSGLLTNQSQTIAGQKTFSSGITITVGSGTSLQFQNASQQLTFNSTAQQILINGSDSLRSNRTLIKPSVGGSVQLSLGITPGVNNRVSEFVAYNSSSVNTSAFLSTGISSSIAYIDSNATGSGQSGLPLHLQISGSSKFIINTDGNIQVSGSLTSTGSISATSGFTGSLFGTASYVTGALFTSENPALTASHAINSVTASLATIVDVASFQLNNNYRVLVGGLGTGPNFVSSHAGFTFNPVTNVLFVSQSVSASSFTGSLLGTASFATTAAFATNTVTATQVSSNLTQGTGITAFTYNGSSAQTVAVAGASTLTTNELVKWNGTAFADSNIFDNGTNVFVTASTLIISGASTAMLVTGSVRSTGGFTGSLFGTSSWSSFAVTASYVTGSVHTSTNPALSASYALSSSYALNGGVTQIVAGTNVTISPTSGLGAVTINAAAGAAFPYTGSAKVTGSMEIIGPTTITGSLVVSGSNGAGIFSQGATLVDYSTGISNSGSYMVWRAPFSCSVVGLYGYYIGGTAPQINAARSGSSGYGRITGSNLTITQANVWLPATSSGLQNTAFNSGDSLQVIMSGSANNQLAVQVDFIRKF